MKARELTKHIDFKKTQNLNDLEVKGIAYNSRMVKENFVFIALKGSSADGHQFINDAVARGAKTIIVMKKSSVLPSDVGEIVVEDTRKALHTLASVFYGEPTKKIKLAGITGTNGKTTTAFILKKILESAGNKCGLIGTISYQVGERVISSINTTPESLDLQKMFSDMLEEECKWAVMEVSSHGIAQGRISKIHFDAALFTNAASHEHLDYHKTFRRYLEAKIKFFSLYFRDSEKKDKTGIINADDPYSRHFIKALRKNSINCITFGSGKADIKLVEYRIQKDGNFITTEIEGKKEDFYTNIRGLGNVYNTLAGIAFARSQNISMDVVRGALKEISSVPGRFESVNEGQPFEVIVDYAHTHHALQNLLKSLKELKPRHIILVFGCGGDRDKSKRPLMGRVASRMADIVFITSDNPRSEDPEDIIRDIERGVPFYLRRKYVSIPDRKQAIKEAISIAGEGDCVVIAGKGHETFQILKNTTIPFDDREEARKSIRLTDL